MGLYNNRDVFSAFFRGQHNSLTASNSSFTANFNNNTALSGSINLSSLSGDFGAIVRHVHFRLGSPIVLVELTTDQVAAAFEEANLKFSSIVNTFFIESWIANLLGVSQNYSSIDYQSTLPLANNAFLQVFAQSSLMHNDIYSGKITKRKGYIDLTTNQQIYDIYSSGYDQSTGLPLEQYVASVTGYGVNFVRLYHNEGAYVNRLYDPYGGQQFLNSEFQNNSYQNDIVYQVIPLFQELQRSAIMSDYDYIRRSAYNHNIFGRKVEFTPVPKADFRVWFDFFVEKAPGAQIDPLLEGSFSGLSYLAASSATGNRVATNFGNIPINDLTYERMNPIGRTWIREYTLALCMETLGMIRGKVLSIPVPGRESITLNYGELLSRADSIKNELLTFLKEELEKMNLYNIMQKEVDKQKQLMELQMLKPLGIYTDKSLKHV